MWKPIALPYKELPGLSSRLLRDHHRLYEGYVDRWNGIHQKNRAWTAKDGDEWEFGHSLFEEGFLRNAGLLHELYFGQLVPGGRGTPADFFGKERDDKDAARHFVGMMRKASKSLAGWVILALDPSRRLFVMAMKDHITGFVAGAWPLLVLDCYEHAYMAQYGLDKDGYVDAFFRNVNWLEVERRTEEAVSAESMAGAAAE